MRINKSKTAIVKPVISEKEYDESLMKHREAVNQNQKKHLALSYYKQFYNTLVLDSDQLNRCKIQDLQTIPAVDFFQLCKQFDEMSLQKKLNPQLLSNNHTQIYQNLSQDKHGPQQIETFQNIQQSKRTAQKLIKRLKPRDRVLKKDLENLCSKKLQQMQIMHQRFIEQRTQKWKQIDLKLFEFKRTKTMAKKLNICYENVEFVLQLFHKVSKFAQKSKQKVIDQIATNKYSCENDQIDISRKIFRTQGKSQQQINLYLSQFIAMSNSFLSVNLSKQMVFKEFSQMIEDLISLINQFTQRSSRSLYLIPIKQLLKDNKTFNELSNEIDKCFTLFQKDYQNENPYFRYDLNQLMKKYSTKLKTLFQILTMIGN